ncbi:replication protein [Priestia megaterium]
MGKIDLKEKIDFEKQKENMDALLKGFIESNFSKRQAKVLAFISYLARQNNCGIAVIPKLRYFKNCGVGPNHIKRELEGLVAKKVIHWNKEKMLFQINYSEEFWEDTDGHEVDRELCDFLTELNTF